MYAAATGSSASDGAESLIAWLQGESAQRSLATTGAAYPIDGALAADTKAGWLMGITGEAVVADETVGSLDALDAWLATWTAALAEPASTPSQTPAADAGTDPGTPNAGDEQGAGQDQAPADETGDGDPGDEE